jgi:NitT/TauT family transport system substrate-binding protein/putative hydroxymethylpyrimidine transport system substrate-binding protein
VTIGFNAVSSLAAGRVDAATGFWNAEGVELRRRSVPVRVFKVNRYGAPPYPELILTTSRRTLEQHPGLVERMVAATTRGYRFAVEHPAQALDDLLASVPSLDRGDQAAQLRVLRPDLRPAPFDPAVLEAWAKWDFEHGLLDKPLDPYGVFQLNP